MSSSSQVVESWISSFCGLLGHEYFAEVSEDFIEDDFNLTGLSSQIPMYKEALEMILDVEPEEDEDEDEEEDDDEDDDILMDENNRPLAYRRADRRQNRLNNDITVIESSAELLYGMIHQRYITSRPGIGQMKEKYDMGHFGACPRVNCFGARVLPVGLSDTPGQETVKLFCPSCLDVYTPPNSRFQTVDGAYFGTTFGCLFLMTFPEDPITNKQPSALEQLSAAGDDPSGNRSLYISPTTTSSQRSGNAPTSQPVEINGVPTYNFGPGLGKGHIYEPRIYGFKVSERSKAGPRMRWLRMKPDDVTELDEARRYQLMENVDDEEEDAGYLEDGDEEMDQPDEATEGAEQGEQAATEEQRIRQYEVEAEVARRKKAPMRRRTRRPEQPQMDEAGGTMDINGVQVR